MNRTVHEKIEGGYFNASMETLPGEQVDSKFFHKKLFEPRFDVLWTSWGPDGRWNNVVYTNWVMFKITLIQLLYV